MSDKTEGKLIEPTVVISPSDGDPMPPLSEIITQDLRVVVYVDSKLGTDVVVDHAGLSSSIARWLAGDEPLVLLGISRVELYDLRGAK